MNGTRIFVDYSNGVLSSPTLRAASGRSLARSDGEFARGEPVGWGLGGSKRTSLIYEQEEGEPSVWIGNINAWIPYVLFFLDMKHEVG